MMRVKTVGVLVSMAMCLSVVAGAKVFKFDFGTKDSPVEQGYTRVSPLDAFSAEKGFGWVGDGGKKKMKLYAENENFSVQSAFLKLGSILCDHVTGGHNYSYPARNYIFKVKLPKGEYVAAAIMGKITEKHASRINRPPYFYSDYVIKVNGKNVFEMKRGNLRKYMSDVCRSSEENFLPGDSLFDKYLKRYFPIREFSFSGDEALIEISSVCPINALLIYPKNSAGKMREELSSVMAREADLINAQYKEKKPEIKQLPDDVAKKFSNKGMILFNSPDEEITPYAIPDANQAYRPVGEFLPAGEKGVLRFGLLPLVNLKNVGVKVSDFVSKDGKNKISHKCFDLWLSNTTAFTFENQTIYYQIRPWYAFPYKKQSFKANASRQFFLYVKLPTTTKPGDYSGKITFTSPQGSADYKLFIKALPFKLAKPDTTFGMYAYSPWHTRLRFAGMQSLGKKIFSKEETFELTNEFQEKAMTEMVESGFNTVAQGPNGLFDFNKNGVVVEKGEGLKYWNAFMKIYKKIFGTRPIPAYGIGWGGVISERNTGFWCQNIKAFKKEGLTDEAKKKAGKLVEKFYETSKKQGWPEVIFYVQDEMANYGIWGGRLALARTKCLNKLSKKLGFKTCASMNGSVELPELPYLDIAIPNGGFPLNKKNVKQIRKDGCEYWIYNIGSKRYTFGYYLTKDKPKGRLQWSFYGNHGYLSQVPCLPSLGSNVFTTMWNSDLIPSRRLDVEAIRQGILDYRYFVTLEELVAKDKGSSKPELAKAAKKGEALLDMIKGGVEVDVGKADAGIWSHKTCQRLRWRLASAIMEVRNAE